MFECPPLPALSSSGISSIADDSSLQSYRDTLRRQLGGRTTGVQDTVGILEDCANAYATDLALQTIGNDSETRYARIVFYPNCACLTYQWISFLHSIIAKQLAQKLQPDCHLLCTHVVDGLISYLDESEDSHGTSRLRIHAWALF